VQVDTNVHSTYVDMRPAYAKMVRDTAIKELNDTPNVLDKIAAAATYAMSFEFQVWKGTGTDDLTKREGLKEDAIDEFFRNTSRYIKDMGDFSPLSFKNETKSLLALSLGMSEINRNQK